jgi:hypothetical protein
MAADDSIADSPAEHFQASYARRRQRTTAPVANGTRAVQEVNSLGALEHLAN